MSLNEKNFESIERYLNGEMPPEERSVLEERLKTDEEFAKEFQAHEISYKIIVGKQLMELKLLMGKDLNGKPPEKTGNKTWKYIAGAGGIIGIALLLYFLFTKDNIIKKIDKPQDQKQRDTIIQKPVLDDSLLNSNKADSLPPHLIEMKKTSRKTNNADLCTDSLVSFSCQASASCSNLDNGSIEIDLNTIKTGKPPFEFSVDPDTNYDSEGVISDLKPGKYNIFIKDARNCIRKLNVKVEVPEIICDHKVK